MDLPNSKKLGQGYESQPAGPGKSPLAQLSPFKVRGYMILGKNFLSNVESCLNVFKCLV